MAPLVGKVLVGVLGAYEVTKDVSVE